MNKNKVIGALLLVLAVATVVGMVLANDSYWLAYNYAVVIISVVGGIGLLRQK